MICHLRSEGGIDQRCSADTSGRGGRSWTEFCREGADGASGCSRSPCSQMYNPGSSPSPAAERCPSWSPALLRSRRHLSLRAGLGSLLLPVRPSVCLSVCPSSALISPHRLQGNSAALQARGHVHTHTPPPSHPMRSHVPVHGDRLPVPSPPAAPLSPKACASLFFLISFSPASSRRSS